MIDIQAALGHFEKNDKQLSQLAKQYPDLDGPKGSPVEFYFQDLCESIVSQQLSVKAAATIWSRVHVLLDKTVSPTAVLNVTDEELRSAGLSRQKITYLKSLAQHTKDKGHLYHDFPNLDDQQIIDTLIQVKGIGKWTAEMFLIFTMARPNVFSIGDLGLRRGFEKLYGMSELFSHENPLIQSYSPYGSTAALLLWKSLDNKPL